jgi:hypothetical protein
MTSSSPVLSESFIANSKQYKWDTTNKCLFTNGYYSLMQNPGYLLSCNAEATNFSNFVYQVTFTIVHGDCGGISFRAQNPTNFYFFEICQNGDHKGQYRFAIVTDGNENDKIGFTQSPAINTGINQPNTIAVIANGGAFVIKVNYHEVDTASDGTFRDGKIGVFAEAQHQQTLVEFSNAQVWNL